jgi:DNA (cytosine-5)-methyltransferase 1
MNELALFAGAGGGILGGKLLGWRTVCAVEWDGYARDVLVARQNDGCLAPFPIWDDIQTFDGRRWRGRVDVVSGGFPCQDISAAGKGAGIEGEKSGMWKHMARIIGEVRPQYAFVENSPLLMGRGLSTVLSDLAEMGYDAKWGIVGAHHASAPHKRDRIWILATDSNLRGCNNGGDSERQHEANHAQVGEATEDQQSGSLWKHRTSANGCDVADSVLSNVSTGDNRRGEQVALNGAEVRVELGSSSEDVADAYGAQRQGNQRQERIEPQHANFGSSSWWEVEPNVGRVADGVAARVDKLRCIGNGQVPAVAQLSWNLLR